MQVSPDRLQRFFNPKTVAVVGDSKARNYTWLKNYQGVKGTLYSVHINEKEAEAIQAMGIPNYKTLMDIPEPVDYVLITVGRKYALGVVADCIEAKVGGAAMFTSGFDETDEEGRTLQRQLREMAFAAGLPIMGPNCMGLYNPSAGVKQFAEQVTGKSGPVGVLGQSGTHTIHTSVMLHNLYGINVSQGFSIGNAAVLDVPDYIEYLGKDDRVKVIAAYIEGIKDGRRLFEVLRDVAARKPVLIWKGGTTQAGAGAASTHTGSLAGSQAIWDTLAKQTGAIAVGSQEELVDTAAALLKLPRLLGPKGAMTCSTGGQSVVVTDAFAAAGLEIPRLSPATYKEFASFWNVIGSFYANPLDLSHNSNSGNLVVRVLDILDRDPAVDFLATELYVPFYGRRLNAAQANDISVQEALKRQAAKAQKPFFVMLTPSSNESDAIELRKTLNSDGILTFPTYQRAAAAYANALRYWRSQPA